MPKTKSAQKALRSSLKKKANNKKNKENIKNALKKAQKTKKATDVKKAISLIDKAAKTNIFHKNKAARLKSRLAKTLHKKESTTADTAPKKPYFAKASRGKPKRVKKVKK